MCYHPPADNKTLPQVTPPRHRRRAGRERARLPGKGNSNSHGARPVHLIITVIKWIQTSRLSIKNSLSPPQGTAPRRRRRAGRSNSELQSTLVYAMQHKTKKFTNSQCKTQLLNQIPYNYQMLTIRFTSRRERLPAIDGARVAEGQEEEVGARRYHCPLRHWSSTPNAERRNRNPNALQGYLAHKKLPPHRTLQYVVGLCRGSYGDPRGVGVSYERGTPVLNPESRNRKGIGPNYWGSRVRVWKHQRLGEEEEDVGARGYHCLLRHWSPS